MKQNKTKTKEKIINVSLAREIGDLFVRGFIRKLCYYFRSTKFNSCGTFSDGTFKYFSSKRRLIFQSSTQMSNWKFISAKYTLFCILKNHLHVFPTMPLPILIRITRGILI